jgi:hypothetical protein
MDKLSTDDLKWIDPNPILLPKDDDLKSIYHHDDLTYEEADTVVRVMNKIYPYRVFDDIRRLENRDELNRFIMGLPHKVTADHKWLLRKAWVTFRNRDSCFSWLCPWK